MEHNEGNADVIRSTRNLLSLLTSQSGSAAGPSQDNVRLQFRVREQLFKHGQVLPWVFYQRTGGGKGGERFSAATTVLGKPAKVKPFIFYLLPRQYDRTPKEQNQLLHTQAGLGRRTAYIDENATYNEISAQLKELYPQLKELTGGWLIYKASGDVAVGEGVTRYFFSAIIQRLKAGFSINLGHIERTCLFEGEPGHLVPLSSQFLIEGDMFLVAGRMLGHSFLHGGPRLPGLSRAIVRVLRGDSPETATVQIEDCPDHDIREIIKLVDGDDELREDECQAVLESFLGSTWPNQYKQKVAL
ncbi:uncharacterized protein LOC143484809 isoform X2 [Brachyhypopomus gauderio]|uniref:uncharacterized protein LOC143484809 isoform X2 n=1 Tax=Brachyhypopomus gauderio TaxID=698409 RepID=UPI004042CC1C